MDNSAFIVQQSFFNDASLAHYTNEGFPLWFSIVLIITMTVFLILVYYKKI